MRKLTAVLIPILALPAMAKDVMLMNRIGPFSADGKEVVFRSWGSNEIRYGEAYGIQGLENER
jgi:hypothetical protein